MNEREWIQLKAWGVNEQRYASVEPVHHLIEQQVIARPDATALIFGDTELSYAELNRRANRLAHRLIALGIQPESRVGIAVERSIDMIVGLLAILKAGGAYVPLDPDYPRDRLQYMVMDSGIELLLTQQAIESRIPRPVHGNVLLLDTLDVSEASENNPAVAVHGEHLAYIIYTSGSTGKPKGVAVAHGPLAMHIQAIGERYGMTPDDRELQFASINFDGAHERWLVPLAFGAALMPRDEEIWPADRTAAEIAKHRITIACFTPGYLQQLAEFTGSAGRQLPIRSYTVGGEAMSRSSYEFVQATLQPPRIINGYGPTETVITPLIYKATPTTRFDSGYLPIGSPVGDRTAYILDMDMNPLPVGVTGELYLGGRGLARGYLNRPGLTAERFVADPFDSQGGRLYRTGDLARWREDGQIEYLGRVDHQVKIRGFRIELGEIETQLLQQSAVREAVVVAKEGPSGTRLVAYVSLHADHAATSPALREALAQSLPDYMLPSAIVVLDNLPLNANGKVDRKRLPEPEFVGEGDYAAPEGEVEQVLANIWAEVLGIGQVGRNDNFFELGGDSILSLQIVTKARRAGWKITPRQLFERQTIAALAVVAKPVEEDVQTAFANEMRIDATVPIPLLPIQLEFFEQPISARHHWNQAVLLTSRQRLQAEWLGRALQAIMQHHRALRFCYEEQADGHWIQRATASVAQEVLWVREAADPAQFIALCNAAQHSFDLHNGPLLRALLIDMVDGTQRLLLVVHHLGIDGVSWRILLEDLEAAYDQATRNETIVLPAATTDYVIWAERLQHFPVTHADEFAYWQSLAVVPVALPCDNPEGSNALGHIDSLILKLDQAHTQALLKDAPAAYRTQVNDLLLTALGSALCRWSGHERILVDLEGHGREDLYADVDLSRTIGWFTSLFPVALDPTGNLDARIKRIKEGLRQIPHKGLGYGLFKYYGTEAQRRTLANLPKAQVVFNYLGQFDGSFEHDTPWQLADEPIGDLLDQGALQQHDLSINGHILGGELCLEVSYSKARYARTNIEAFTGIFFVELESVITHCQQGIRAVTPSDFPLIRSAQDELDYLPIPLNQLEDLYPLSPMQTGMLFHSVFDTDAGAYLNQLRADIDHLSLERFKAAWQAAIDRHEILRTGFLQEGNTPLQWVAKRADLPFVVIDWRDRTLSSSTSLEQALDDLAQSEHRQGIDLKKPPLLRIAVVCLADERYHIIMTIHHLLLDGWSTSQLLGEILRQYGGATLSTPRVRYRDFIEWLQRHEREASEAYWQAWLRQFNLPTKLAGSIAPPSAKVAKVGYGEAARQLDPIQVEALVHFSRQERITVNTLVQAAWALLLGYYTGQHTVTFGVTVAGRPADLPGSDQMLGLFINTLPVNVELKPSLSVGEWLRGLQAQNLASREHEHTPLYEIQRWAGQQRQALFDSILVFENYPLDEAFKQHTPGGLVISGVKGREETNYPMTVSVVEKNGFHLHYSYDGKYFSESAVHGIAAQIEKLLCEITQSAANRLGELILLDEVQQAQLKLWGINERRYVSEEPVHQLIEQQAILRPNATALIFGDTELSYAELNRRANRLAHRLIALGIQPESRVGIAVERSIDMIVGLFAILKAGGAYVPLDPDYPRERLQYMVTDSAIELLLTQQAIEARIPRPAHGNVLLLDTLDVSGYPENNPPVAVHGEHLAYIIYTSGSTGQPKGVAVAHHALVEHALIAVEFFKLSSADRMLQFSTINFDGFIEQLFPPLCVGATIVLRGPALWDSETFYQELIAKQITVADLTTAYWFLLVQDFARQGPRDYGVLRQVHAGGEAMSPEGIKAWRQAGLSGVVLLNTYGPTEAIVTATVADCGEGAQGDQQDPVVTIGKPLPARRIYLLDANLMPVAPGIAGELYIGGELLARGYLNRPGLTAERFVADPFDSQCGRLYRTGDLARWREDGQIEYLGRVDHQVKIRGFRIELGEIETQLLQQPAVREAVVVAKEGSSGTKLVAYVSLHAAHAVTPPALREALAQSLPDYMLPSAIVVLDNLPLNANGKVERKRLPEPEFVSEGDYAAPEGEVEQVLANIWAEVLGMSRVGRNDNFFELGGDSILSLQIVTKARRAGWKITPRQLFERQTIAALAMFAKPVEEDVKIAFAKQMEINATAPIPLLPIQLDFFEQPIPARHHWNQAVLLTSRQRLRAEWLDRALKAVIQHHRALRFYYEEQADGHWIQRATASAAQEVLWVREAADPAQFLALCNAAQRSLDLRNGPLLRALLIDMADGMQHLLLAVHHLVIDGVSWRILLEDLKAAYDQSIRNETVVLPEVTTDYAIWTQRLQHFPVTHAAEFACWQRLAGVPASLPCDFPEGSRQIAHQYSLTVKLDRLTTQALLKEAPAAYRTQVNDLLLTALGSALCRWSSHERILIDLEGHGREDLYADVDFSRTIGWFTSQFPIALGRAGEIAQRIKGTKEMLRQIPYKGLGYGLFKYYGTEAQRHILANLPKAQVVFNYLGQFDAHSEENSLWTLINESVGESMDGEALDEHDISINCHIYEGEFCVVIGYSEARYAQATIETFANSYLAELKSVITHCSHSDAQGVTLSDFPLIRITQHELDRLPIPLDQLADLYPLSPMQAGMLFHSLAETDEDIYLNQFRIDIDGLEVRRFKQAWQAAINRHEILRTGFIQEAGTPLQWVAKIAELPIIEYDWRDRHSATSASLQQDLDALAQAEHALGLELLKPPLMRLVLVRLSDEKYHFIWTAHHLLLDGWSTSQLLSEILREYGGEVLPAPQGRFRDFIEWLEGRDQAASQAYWLERLNQVYEPTRLASALPEVQHGAGYVVHTSELDQNLTDELVRFAKRAHVTVNTLMQAAWALLLKTYTGQSTVTFGVTVAGRPTDLSGSEQMLGLFINTIPVCITLRPEQPIADWLREVQAQNLASREHEHTPLYEIQRWLKQSGQGLFDSILVFENYPIDETLQQSAANGLIFSSSQNWEMSNYPIAVAVSHQRVLNLYFGYDCQYFSKETVNRLASQVKALLYAMSHNQTHQLCDITLLSETERTQLKVWGVNEQRYVSVEPVHRLIEQQVMARPDATALIFGDTELSYAELNRRANQLAHRLITLGIQPESRVGIAVERSIDMIVGLLAILKAGGAYVPLDPDYPRDRLQYMVTDSGIELLLTQQAIEAGIPHPTHGNVLLLDTLDVSDASEDNPVVAVHGEHLAYIIYTSGSTGKPKGVAVTHGPLAMHIQAIGELYGMTPDDRELQFASINFDGAHERWLVPLAFGAALMPRDQEIWPADRTAAEIAKHRITIACFTPGYLQQLAEFTGSAGQQLPIRSYTVGGEAMSRSSYDFVQATLQPPRIINGYGPTETVITPLIYKATPTTRFDSGYLPIGSPVGDRTAYILDMDMNPLPVGVTGELYLGGRGLARGYLNRPGLTAERFVADPFDSQGGRLYRTGDLARWREDGQIEYLGRVDHQVKIRGFRIELGEIETQLLQQLAVQEAVVVAKEGPSGTRLVAYVSLHADHAATSPALREALAQSLPDYMLPSAIVVLDNLPLNANGKVDRKRLPEPGMPSIDTYRAPSTSDAKLLARVWQEVLGVERIGETDNFFALGGDSLSSLKVMARVRNLTNAKLDFKLRDLVLRPTIADLLGLDKLSKPNGLLALNQISENEGAKPLFCIHAGMGTIFDYQPLARQLQDMRTVYGIPCRMLADSAHCDISLQQMAEDYCRMIRSVQPQGPYHLLGWSLGGALAALITAILEAQQQTVAFLGLIDSYVPGIESSEPVQDDWRQDFMAFIAAVLPGVEFDPSLHAAVFGQTMLTESNAQVIALLEKACLLNEKHEQSVQDTIIPDYAAMGVEELAHTFMVARHLKMLSLQIPTLKPLATQAICWWAVTREHDERLMLKQQLSPAEIHAIEVDADHYDILRTESLLVGIRSLLAATRTKGELACISDNDYIAQKM